MRAGQRRIHQPNATGAGKALVDHLTAWHGQGTPYVQQSLFTTTGDLVVGGVGETMLFQGMEYAAPTRLAIGSNGQGLVVDSAQTVGMAWKFGIPVTITRSGDSGNKNDATLANDDTLLWATPGNSTAIWHAEAWLLVNAANATMDVKASFTGPAGATGLIGTGPTTFNTGIGSSTWTAIATGTTPSVLGALGTALIGGTGAATSGFIVAGIFFDGGTAGNFNLQWAQNTIDAGNLKLLKGSFIKVTRLAA